MASSSGVFVDPSTGAVSAGTWAFRNAVINGGFAVNQRGTSTNLGAMTPVPTSAPGSWVADRWNVYRSGYAANLTMALGSLATTDLPFTDAGLSKFARLQRVAGDTSTSAISLTYNFETQDSVLYANKQVTLSFYYRTGANCSGTPTAIIITGTGTDQSLRNGFTNQNYNINSSFSTSTTWQRAVLTGTVPATATQLGILIQYAPTGTAGAADYVDITGVQLERGAVATPFEQKPFPVDLQSCMRYYEKSYNMNTVPGTVSQSVSNGFTPVSWSIASGNRPVHYVSFKCAKFKAPSIVLYNPSTGTQGTLYNEDAGTSSTATGANAVGTNAFSVIWGSTSTGQSAGSLISAHYTADAEL